MTHPAREVADEAEESRRSSRKPAVIIAIATAAALAAGAGIWAAGNRPADGAASATGAVAACPATQTIVVDPSVAPVIESVAANYGDTFTSDCLPIAVAAKPSHEVAEQGLGDAVGWVPEDVVWQTRATGGDGSLASAPQQLLGWSPITVVAPEEFSDALRGQPLSGRTLVDLVTTKTTFADYGHESWGRFKLVLPSPADSVTGAAGFASLARQVGDGQDFPFSAAAATEQQRLMPSVQWRTVAQPGPADVVSQLDPTEVDAPYALGVGPRAGITSEVVTLNQGNRVEGLRAWHLDGGRSGVRVGLIAPAGNPTLDGFAQWLASDLGHQTLLNAGLRVGDRAPAAEQLAAFGLPPEGVSETMGVSRLNWGLLTQMYAAFSHRSATLVVLDASHSMSEPLPGTNARKVDLIADAAVASWPLWPPGSVTGLMTFRTDRAGQPTFNNVIPLQPNNTPEYLADLPAYMGQFQSVQTQGGSPLYEGIWRGYEAAQQSYRPDYTNTIVVLTDGGDEESGDTMSVDALIDNIKESDPDKKVNIGMVVLGAEEDFGDITRIADETGNRAWLVQDPSEVATVLPAIEIAFAS